MGRQFAEQFGPLLKKCQHLSSQPGWIAAAGFPALDRIHTGTKPDSKFLLREIEGRTDRLYISHLLAGQF